MKIKNTHEGALINPAVAAEIEALYMEIEQLKEAVSSNRDALNDLIENLKNTTRITFLKDNSSLS
jgi:predicted transcriptional regulator